MGEKTQKFFLELPEKLKNQSNPKIFFQNLAPLDDCKRNSPKKQHLKVLNYLCLIKVFL